MLRLGGTFGPSADSADNRTWDGTRRCTPGGAQGATFGQGAAVADPKRQSDAGSLLLSPGDSEEVICCERVVEGDEDERRRAVILERSLG